MAIQEVASNQTFAEVARIKKISSPLSSENGNNYSDTPEKKDIQNQDISVEISSYSTNKLHQFNADFNTVLKSIRIADQALAKIESKVEQATSELQTFLKTYPPYPPGSEERIKLLKNFAAIRQQIEQLTMPSDQFAGLLIGNATSDEPSGSYEIRIGGSVVGENLRTNTIPSGGSRFTIPQLSMTAGDDLIAGTAKALNQTKTIVADGRAALSRDTARLIESVH